MFSRCSRYGVIHVLCRAFEGVGGGMEERYRILLRIVTKKGGAGVLKISQISQISVT